MDFEKELNEVGFFQYGIVNPAEIHFSQDVRAMCEMNTCQNYDKTWACPPAIGTVEECKSRILQYRQLLVFSGKYTLEDSFDYEGMVESMKQFSKTCRTFDAKIKPYLKNYLMLSNEGCDLCKECTYPHAPCRFPGLAHGSLEGYGIYVNELANLAKINYTNGSNTVTYFGALAYNPSDLEVLKGTQKIRVPEAL